MPRTTRRDLVKLGAAATLVAGATAAPAVAPRRNGRRLPIGYPLGPFTRDKANPILRPGTQPWESKFVFNPAAIVRNGLIHLLYRAQAGRPLLDRPRHLLRRRPLQAPQRARAGRHRAL